MLMLFLCHPSHKCFFVICIYIYIYTTCYMYVYICIYHSHVYHSIYHSHGFACQQRVLKTFPGPGYLHFEDGVVWLRHWLVNLYIWLTISSCYNSIPLALGLLGRDSILSTLVSKLRVCLSTEGAKNISWLWLSPLRGWSSLIMALTGKFVYMAHNFILLRLDPFGLRVDREGW